MKAYLQRNLRNDFVRSLMTLTSGTAVGGIIPVLISPILSRIYTPADFGLLALFLAISGTLGVLATARYDQAIVVAENEEQAASLVHLSLLVSVFVSAAFAVLSLIFSDLILHQFGEAIAPWIKLVPIFAFGMAFNQTLIWWMNRKKQFRYVAILGVAQAVAVAAVAIAFGYRNISGGLIWGWLTGLLIADAVAAFLVYRDLSRATVSFSVQSLLSCADKFKDFALKGTPSAIASALAGQSLIFFSTGDFGPSAAGHLDVLNRIWALYMVIFGKNIAYIFFQKLSGMTTKEAYPYTVKLGVRLFAMSFLAHIFILFFIVFLLVPVFGHQWVEAVAIGKVMVVVSFFSSVFSPMSIAFNYFRMLGFNLVFQCAWLATDAALFFMASKFGWSFYETMVKYTLKQSLLYIVGFCCFYALIRKKSQTDGN